MFSGFTLWFKHIPMKTVIWPHWFIDITDTVGTIKPLKEQWCVSYWFCIYPSFARHGVTSNTDCEGCQEKKQSLIFFFKATPIVIFKKRSEAVGALYNTHAQIHFFACTGKLKVTSTLMCIDSSQAFKPSLTEEGQGRSHHVHSWIRSYITLFKINK